jgi:hypothetical protein
MRMFGLSDPLVRNAGPSSFKIESAEATEYEKSRDIVKANFAIFTNEIMQYRLLC